MSWNRGSAIVVVAVVASLGAPAWAGTAAVYVDDDYSASTPGWGATHFDNLPAAIGAVDAGGTVSVHDGTYAHSAQVGVAKPVTIQGVGATPTLSFSDGAYDGLAVTSDDVTLDNLRFYRDGHSAYNALVSIPKGGGYPNYTVEHDRVTIRGCTFDGGRYGLYAAPGDLTVQGNTFQNGYRDSIILIGGSGTNTISGNHFTGEAGSKKAILIEPASGEPPISGTLNVENNTVYGKRNFLVFNHWNHPDTDTLTLNVTHNSICGTASGVLAFYAAYTDDADGFDKFSDINIQDNIISQCGGLAVCVDYEDWGGAPAADNRPVAPNGFIDVANNLAFSNEAGDEETTDATGNYGYVDIVDMTPSGASMAMFDLSGNAVGDPGFADPANGDFSITDLSPAWLAASDGLNVGAWQVPEPATMALLAVGGLAALGRRRQRRATSAK